MKILKILKIMVIGSAAFFILIFMPIATLIISTSMFWHAGFWLLAIANSLWIIAPVLSLLLLDLYHDKINK